MMRQIRERERRVAEANGWNTAILGSVLAAANGVKDVDPAIFNPHHVPPEKTTQTGRKGVRLSWMTPAAAEGLLQAAELDVIPIGYWVGLAPLWEDITQTARFYGR